MSLIKSELTGKEKLSVANTPEKVSGFHFLSHYFLLLFPVLFNEEWLVLPCLVL